MVKLFRIKEMNESNQYRFILILCKHFGNTGSASIILLEKRKRYIQNDVHDMRLLLIDLTVAAFL